MNTVKLGLATQKRKRLIDPKFAIRQWWRPTSSKVNSEQSNKEPVKGSEVNWQLINSLPHNKEFDLNK